MTKLPDVSDLGPAPVADRSRPIADYSAGGQALARGAEQLGQGISRAGQGAEQLGQSITELRLAQNHWEYAKANSWFHSALIDQEDKTKQDTNYGPDDEGKSLTNRHAEAVWGLRDQAAQMIPSGPMRELFNMRVAPTIARSIEGARGHARTLEHQASDAYAIQAGQDLIDKAPNAADEATRRDAIDGQNLLIDGLGEKGVLTRDQVLGRKKQFAQHYATAAALGDIERDPVSAAKALANPGPNSVYSIIPPEHRMTLLNTANTRAGHRRGLDAYVGAANGEGAPVVATPNGVRAVVDTGPKIQQATEGLVSVVDPDTGENIAPAVNAEVEDKKRQRETAPGGAPSGGQMQPAVVGTPGTAASLKAAALRRILTDRDVPDEQKHAAFMAINEASRMTQIASEETAQARREASESAAGGYATNIWDMAHSPNKDWVTLADKINHDPALDFRTKDALLDRLTKLSGGDEEISFGPGYLAARAALFSSAADPLHKSLADIAKDATVTERGLHDLTTRWNLANKDLDRHSIEQRATDYLKYAYSKLSFEEDNGLFKLRDPKGQAIYYSQFAPEFTKQLSELITGAAESGDRSKLDQFLSRESVDKMIRNYRDPKDMARDRLAATGEAGGQAEAPNAPIPATPQGYDDGGWKSLMRSPPTANHAQWAAALKMLVEDPSLAPTFDHTYGAYGYTAKDVLPKLGTHAAAPAPAQPAVTTPGAASAAAPPLPWNRPPEALQPLAATAPPKAAVPPRAQALPRGMEHGEPVHLGEDAIEAVKTAAGLTKEQAARAVEAIGNVIGSPQIQRPVPPPPHARKREPKQ